MSIAPKPKSIKASTKPSQKSILAGAVRKRVNNDNTISKSNDEDVPAKVSKVDNSNNSNNSIAEANGNSDEHEQKSSNNIDLSVHNKGALKCIGILPGIGKYKDSSDSEKSTDTDDDYDFSDFDWVGRKMKKHDDDCDW